MSDEILLMELPCPECDGDFALKAPDAPPGSSVEQTVECPHCSWSQTVEMEVE